MRVDITIEINDEEPLTAGERDNIIEFLTQYGNVLDIKEGD